MTALCSVLDRYLAMRRGFGFKLISEERQLRDFVAFMAALGATVITAKLAIEWASRVPGPASWSKRLSTVRCFARHVANSDARTETPPVNVFQRHHRRRPHIYIDREIEDLLAAMLALPPHTGLRRWTFHCFFGLIAVTGLRCNEAINLRRDDVDLGAGVITVRGTKFNKTRLVPIDPTTVAVLKDYGIRRDAKACRRANPRFIVGERGARLYHQQVQQIFINWVREAGLRGQTARKGPCIHDLRHSYAVRTLERWYRADEDIERLLPSLATYLGHAHIRSTYWYLSASPELLGQAVRRLEARWEAAS